MKKFAPPLFTSPLLNEVANAADRRGKSIRKHARLVCSHAEEGPFERIDYHLDKWRTEQIRVTIWSDARLWVFAAKCGPRRTGGYAYRHHFACNVAELDGADIIRRLEQTIMFPEKAAEFWPHVYR